jgi:hypothetical protein
MGFITTSCSRNNEPIDDTIKENCKRTVLLYAVASNSLYTNLISDKSEILESAKYWDTDKFNFLVYQVIPERYNEDPILLKVSKNKINNTEEIVFDTLKTYDRETYSTDPARLEEVINDAKTYAKADDYGLILWSHGSAWTPESSDHVVPEGTDGTSSSSKVLRAFGQDIYRSKEDWFEIDELADAIPDGMFSFIWFDSCYMSNIETIYEFRNKCKTFIGYPTEINAKGMPYDQTMPYVMQETPDFIAAAMATYNYYDLNSLPVTIAVLDMTKIEQLADATKNLYSNFSKVSTYGLLKYSRGSKYYYDFYDYSRRVDATNSDTTLIDSFTQALNDFTVFKAASSRGFNGGLIDAEIYSGISTHVYTGIDSENENYYRNLDWYKRVYPQ